MLLLLKRIFKKQQDDKTGNKKRTWKIYSIKKKKRERYFGKYCYIQPANIAISIIMLSLKYKIMFDALIILNNQLDFFFCFISIVLKKEILIEEILLRINI